MDLLCRQCGSRVQVPPNFSSKQIACLSCGSSIDIAGEETQSFQSHQPSRFGRFEIVQTLGAGSFGTVYKARDSELSRVVALKVPRLDRGVTGFDVERFKREARAAAQLQHPAIVSIYEVGEIVLAGPSGASLNVPYIVSEYVEGVTLADFLTGKKLTYRDSALLVAQLAQALEYAHSRGVIHRDIKPSNVMIQSDGSFGIDSSPERRPSSPAESRTERPSVEGRNLRVIARLMDFGLAKREQGEATVTLEGDVLGTPAYMSPEQAAGHSHNVDGRSDVYSLGVVLYELLTGERPFRGNPRMLFYQILHEEPAPPRRLDDRIPADLETICLRAMAKEPNQRYHGAGAMAEDLLRWLDGEPIQARPVGRAERLLRWCRRNPKQAALTVLVLCLVLVLSVGGPLAAWREVSLRQLAQSRESIAQRETVKAALAADLAQRAQQEAELQRRHAMERAQQAEEARRQAEERQRDVDAILQFIYDHIVSPTRPKGLKGGQGRDITVLDAIEAALPSLEASFRDQPVVEASIRLMLGESLFHWGRYGPAREQAARAKELLSRHAGSNDRRMVEADHLLALCLQAEDGHEEAAKLLTECLRRSRNILKENDPLILIVKKDLATSYWQLGLCREALQVIDEILTVSRETLGPDHPDTLALQNELGSYLAIQGRYPQAVLLLTDVLRKRTAVLGLKHQDTLKTQYLLAECYKHLGRSQEALSFFQIAHAGFQEVLGATHPDALECQSSYAVCLAESGRLEQAAPLFEDAVEGFRDTLGPEDRKTVQALYNWAICLRKLGKYKESLPLMERVVVLNEMLFGPTDQRTLIAMDELGGTYLLMDREEEGLAIDHEVLSRRMKTLPSSHPDVIKTKANLAMIHSRMGKVHAAVEEFEQIVSLSGVSDQSAQLYIHVAEYNLAGCYRSLREYEKAVPLHEKLLGFYSATYGTENMETLEVAYNLAWCYRGAQRYKEGADVSLEYQDRARRIFGPEHSVTLGFLNNRALCLNRLGQSENALALAEEAVRLTGRSTAPRGRAAEAQFVMGEILVSMEKVEEARKCFEQAVELSRKAGPENLLVFEEIVMGYCNWLIRQQDWARCARLAEECDGMLADVMEAEPKVAGKCSFVLARVHAAAAFAAVQVGESETAKKHTAEATQWLARATDSGFCGTKEIESDTGLGWLRAGDMTDTRE